MTFSAYRVTCILYFVRKKKLKKITVCLFCLLSIVYFSKCFCIKTIYKICAQYTQPYFRFEGYVPGCLIHLLYTLEMLLKLKKYQGLLLTCNTCARLSTTFISFEACVQGVQGCLPTLITCMSRCKMIPLIHTKLPIFLHLLRCNDPTRMLNIALNLQKFSVYIQNFSFSLSKHTNLPIVSLYSVHVFYVLRET